MTNQSLMNVVRTATRAGDRNLRMGATIGVVVGRDDPEKLGRVQLQFPFDYQGAHSIYWAMPVYPLGGHLGTDVPAKGTYLLCLFLEGNPSEPFYIGTTRGKPQKAGAQALTTDDGEGLHLAIGEAVDEGFKAILDYLRSHTHRVTVIPQGLSGPPGAPISGLPSPAETMTPGQATPRIKSVQARYVRMTADNRDEPTEDGHKGHNH